MTAAAGTQTFSIRPSRASDHDGLVQLVSHAGVFSAEDLAVAVELIEDALADEDRDGDYRILVAEAKDKGALVGYICYGPTPMTQAAWDLYWLATDPNQRRQGIAAALCIAMEDEIRGHNGHIIRVETSSTDGYGAAQRFYERNGYPEKLRIPDFYKPGDDLIIMVKLL